ncbi:hypothetical protein [Ralstonia pseudosolanacearum]|uniref:hypothetical protein n=1 Tax=Ralstonia pseudosolanacearum TaxID=1310165 RepID=UPI003D04151E
MKTEAYVDVGKVVTDHIAPVNAVMTASTAILLPTLDFVRPHFPYINQVAILVVAAFLALLSMKLLNIPKDRQLRPSVLLCAGVCAAAFSIGAMASTRHAEQGGLAKDNGNEELASYLAEIGLKTDSYQAWHKKHPK